MPTVIGIDFDNTIVCCDQLFFDIAREMEIVPESIARTKNAVREHIRTRYSNDRWTILQSEVYGRRLLEAKPYPGVVEFFTFCRAHAVSTCIISHKSRYPAAGERCDLHRSALAWLSENGFFSVNGSGLSPERVVFAPSRQQKIRQIYLRECAFFIDDLPEVFAEADFPVGTGKILFDPSDTYREWASGVRAISWDEVRKTIFHGTGF